MNQFRCSNCNKKFEQNKLHLHQAYCRKNFKKCPECNQFYDTNYKSEHQQEFHRKIKCKFCHKEFHPNHIQTHQYNCSYKTISCKFCQIMLSQIQIFNHQRECGSRTKECQKCRKNITVRDYKEHLRTCKGIVKEQAFQPKYEMKKQGMGNNESINVRTQIIKEKKQQQRNPYFKNNQKNKVKKIYEKIPQPNKIYYQKINVMKKNEIEKRQSQKNKPNPKIQTKTEKTLQNKNVFKPKSNIPEPKMSLNPTKYPSPPKKYHEQNLQDFDNHQIDQDQQLQKAIMQSMNINPISNKIKNKDFQNDTLMNNQFYNNLNIEEQKKILQQYKRK